MRRSHDPLFDEGRRRHPVLGFLLLLAVVILVTVTVLNGINNSRVNLAAVSVTAPTLPSSLENFRILHISDLHGLYFGPHQEQLQAAIASARFNVVCVTGDVTGPDGDAGAFLELIRLFQGKAPVYFIPGDEDPAPITAAPHGNPTAKADYILAAESAGAVYLDAPVKIAQGKVSLWLSPEWIYTLDLDAAQTAYANRREELLSQAAAPERDAALAAVEYQLDQVSRIRQARRETLETDLQIGLAHQPLGDGALAALREWTISENDSHIRAITLLLAGHYVAGQWRLPGVGPVRVSPGSGLGKNGWFPPDNLVSGLSTAHGIPQYISPGLGVSAESGLPPIRLFNTPAVTVVTLTSRLTF